ncbi:hypothetical protein HMPREF2724_08785 [Corynebacterium sp. HMSC071F07]|nr:hypothetical protein HMPREF2724_08785 [Corynebacterium sp. HMSC071F07]
MSNDPPFGAGCRLWGVVHGAEVSLAVGRDVPVIALGIVGIRIPVGLASVMEPAQRHKVRDVRVAALVPRDEMVTLAQQSRGHTSRVNTLRMQRERHECLLLVEDRRRLKAIHRLTPISHQRNVADLRQLLLHKQTSRAHRAIRGTNELALGEVLLMLVETNNYVRSTGWGLNLFSVGDELFEPVEQVVAGQRAEHVHQPRVLGVNHQTVPAVFAIGMAGGLHAGFRLGKTRADLIELGLRGSTQGDAGGVRVVAARGEHLDAGEHAQAVAGSAGGFAGLGDAFGLSAPIDGGQGVDERGVGERQAAVAEFSHGEAGGFLERIDAESKGIEDGDGHATEVKEASESLQPIVQCICRTGVFEQG